MVKLSTNNGYVLRTFMVRYLTIDIAYKFYLKNTQMTGHLNMSSPDEETRLKGLRGRLKASSSTSVKEGELATDKMPLKLLKMLAAKINQSPSAEEIKFCY